MSSFSSSAERESLLRWLRRQAQQQSLQDQQQDDQLVMSNAEVESLVREVLTFSEKLAKSKGGGGEALRWRALALLVQSDIGSSEFTEEIQSEFMIAPTASFVHSSSPQLLLKALHASLVSSSDKASELIRLSTFFHLLERSGGSGEAHRHVHHAADFTSNLALVQMATKLEKVFGDRDVVERLFSQAGFETRTNNNEIEDEKTTTNVREEGGGRGESTTSASISGSSSYPENMNAMAHQFQGRFSSGSVGGGGGGGGGGGELLSTSATMHRESGGRKGKNRKKKKDLLFSSSSSEVQLAIESATRHSLCTLWTENVLRQSYCDSQMEMEKKREKEQQEGSHSKRPESEVDQVHLLCILEHATKQVEKNMLSIETEKLDHLEELSCCGIVVDHIRTLHALTKVVLKGEFESLKTHVETLVLQLMRRVSKRIVNKGTAARASQAIVLIEILKFVLSRSVSSKSDEVYLFDTRRCLSVLFGELFQVHYRNLLVCTGIFDLCSSYEDLLGTCYADLICQGYPTALKASVLWPKKFSVKMACFVQSMNSCDLCIPLVQSVLDAPILALLMDERRGFTRMVEEKASREILQSFVEDEQSNNVEDMMQVEDIFNMLSPKVSDLCSTLDVPSTWPRLLKDIQKMSEQGTSEESKFQGGAGAVRCKLVIKHLMPELLNAVFVSLLEKPQIGKLCSIITLIINRFMSGTLYPNKIFGNTCIQHSLLFISNALHLKPKMLVMLKNTLLRLFILEETGTLQYDLQKVKTSLLREIGIILSGSQSSTFYEDVAYQIVDTLETLIQEKASTWQDRTSKDFNTLKLICAAMTAMTRIVVVHSSLLTRVDLMLRKICHKDSHTFVLNRANESLKLVQMPEDLSYLILQEESSVASAFKKAAKLL